MNTANKNATKFICLLSPSYSLQAFVLREIPKKFQNGRHRFLSSFSELIFNQLQLYTIVVKQTNASLLALANLKTVESRGRAVQQAATTPSLRLKQRLNCQGTQQHTAVPQLFRQLQEVA